MDEESEIIRIKYSGVGTEHDIAVLKEKVCEALTMRLRLKLNLLLM